MSLSREERPLCLPIRRHAAAAPTLLLQYHTNRITGHLIPDANMNVANRDQTVLVFVADLCCLLFPKTGLPSLFIFRAKTFSNTLLRVARVEYDITVSR